MTHIGMELVGNMSTVLLIGIAALVLLFIIIITNNNRDR